MIDSTIPKEIILKVIEAGIQAPSADNMQPWKFKVIQNGFELWLDRENMGLFFDNKGIATNIGCGALIENVTAYAKAAHLSIKITYDNTHSNKFAEFKLTPNKESVSSRLSEAVFNRRTDRNLYIRSKEIPAAVRKDLGATVEANEDFHLHYFQGIKERKRIIRIVTATDFIRFSHEKVHKDFYDVLRFGEMAAKTRDGLAQSTLGIEWFFIPVLKLLKPWKITKILNYIGLHRVMALRGSWLPMVTAPHIVAITHEGTADYLEAGRVMQQFWLHATNEGLSVQPLGALPLFLARIHLSKGKGFSERQIRELQKMENEFSHITPGFNSKDHQLVMLFRLGYTKKPANHSYRRRVESFLLP